jgi:hypothetical protein
MAISRLIVLGPTVVNVYVFFPCASSRNSPRMMCTAFRRGAVRVLLFEPHVDR